MITSSTMIDNYRIRTTLGQGPLGHVYLAQDTMFTHYMVAIKLLDAPSLHSTVEQNQFLQEAHALELVRHQYILHIHDAGIYEKTPFLVSAYISGGSLRQRLTQHAPSPVPVEESLKVLAQIGHALHHAHKQNIIHGNLKPENILFSPQGDALLADFGMKVTQAQQTSNYVAPEQSNGTVSKESDQYALGCIAYELFTGQHPFNRPETATLAAEQTDENPLPPSLLNSALPPSIEQAILKAMAKQPQDRHANVKAFITALCTSPGIGTTQSFIPAIPRPISLQPATLTPQENRVEHLPFPSTPVDTEPIKHNAKYAAILRSTTDKPVQRRRLPAWFLIAAIVPVILLILGANLWHLLPTFLHNGTTHKGGGKAISNPSTPTATISIIPQSKTLKNTYTVLATTAIPDHARHEVAARFLSTTHSQSQTVQATGKNSSPAVQASAVVTLMNNGNTDKTVPAGTNFYYTPMDGSNQLTATTDATVVVPAMNIFIGPGSATVSVHAVTPGAIGNTINNLHCLCKNITVGFPLSFSGGRDAQTTFFVQQQDITTAMTSLQTSLMQNVQSSLKKGVLPNEQLVNTPQCTPATSSNHNAGDQATNVTVTVTISCTGMVYDQQAALAMAATLLKQDAISHPSAIYALTSTFTTTITKVVITDAQRGRMILSVQAQSTGVFQFSDAQKQNMIGLIAGKSKQEVQRILLQQPGVSQITITYSNNQATTLPSDGRNITINVSNM